MKKRLKVFAMLFCVAALGMTASCGKENNVEIIEEETPSVGGFNENGASNALFSVAENKTVRFSRGNLQFCATISSHLVAGGDTVQGYWQFAEHQYDYSRSNNQISETSGYLIDLFGWGTSGWSSGANEYQPWATSKNNRDYYPGGDNTNNLTGNYSNADWGVYNAIRRGGNQPSMWRTLTGDEWRYLLFSRHASTVDGIENARYAKAQVNGVNGLIVFPDYFKLPSSIVLENININNAVFSSNTYSVSAWNKLEDAGAIFLPAAGRRDGTEIKGEGVVGNYWSSTTYTNVAQSVNDAQSINFYNEAVATGAYPRRSGGNSVRLVMD